MITFNEPGDIHPHPSRLSSQYLIVRLTITVGNKKKYLFLILYDDQVIFHNNNDCNDKCVKLYNVFPHVRYIDIHNMNSIDVYIDDYYLSFHFRFRMIRKSLNKS